MPGLLIGRAVHEFIDLSQQLTQVAHLRQEAWGNISLTPEHLDHRKRVWEERRDGGRQRSSHGAIMRLCDSSLRMLMSIDIWKKERGALKTRERIVRSC